MPRVVSEDYVCKVEKPGDFDEFWDDVLIRATQELAVKERMYGPQPKARIERARQIGVRILRI